MSKTLSLLVPVYNEEKRLIKTVTALKNAVLPAVLRLEKVIFVNDGSTDQTLKLLRKYKSEIESATNSEVVITTYKQNRGKGYAIKTGMKYSESDYTLFFDADMSTPLEEISKFVPYMLSDEDVIIGTRKNGHSTVVKHQPKLREYLGKVYTFLSQLILNTWVTDFTCGFKAFSRKSRIDVFSRSLIDRWGYDSEILFLSRKLGYKINEQPVLWSDDRNTKVNLKKAIVTSFLELMKIRTNDLTGKYGFTYSRNTAKKLKLAQN